MAVDSKDLARPSVASGLFTSASTAADVTETLGFAPSFVLCFQDTGATNPNIRVASSADTAQSLLLTGSTGVVTRVAVATGVDIAGNTFIWRSEAQTDSGTNYWVALR